MKKYLLPPTDITPNVVFDPEKELFEISGRSIPANSDELFSSIHNWLKSYLLESKATIVLNMNLEYFNTASHKYIAEIFRMIKDYAPESKINWYYHIDDDEMKQVGEIFDRIFDLEFNIISFNDED